MILSISSLFYNWMPLWSKKKKSFLPAKQQFNLATKKKKNASNPENSSASDHFVSVYCKHDSVINNHTGRMKCCIEASVK